MIRKFRMITDRPLQPGPGATAGKTAGILSHVQFVASEIVELIRGRPFARAADYIVYLMLRSRFKRLLGPVVTLHPRVLNGRAIYCRTNTADAYTIRDVFIKSYHMPLQGLAEPEVIFDLGANVGYTVAHYAATFPRGSSPWNWTRRTSEWPD